MNGRDLAKLRSTLDVSREALGRLLDVSSATLVRAEKLPTTLEMKPLPTIVLEALAELAATDPDRARDAVFLARTNLAAALRVVLVPWVKGPPDGKD